MFAGVLGCVRLWQRRNKEANASPYNILLQVPLPPSNFAILPSCPLPLAIHLAPILVQELTPGTSKLYDDGEEAVQSLAGKNVYVMVLVVLMLLATV